MLFASDRLEGYENVDLIRNVQYKLINFDQDRFPGAQPISFSLVDLRTL